MGRQVDADDLVTAVDIAERLGLAGPAAVHNWTQRHDDFPAPIRKFGTIRVWCWTDIAAWLDETGRIDV